MSDFDLPKGAERKSSRKAHLPTFNQTPTPEEKALNIEETPLNEKDVSKKDPDKEPSEKPKYTDEELLAIFDEVIFTGEYSEEVTIGERLKVVFRTRSAGEIEDISLVVDSTQANLVSTLEQKRGILNLQYALVFYQGKDLRGASIQDKAAFIRKLPAPVIGRLITALVEFDSKVFQACKVGEENF